MKPGCKFDRKRARSAPVNGFKAGLDSRLYLASQFSVSPTLWACNRTRCTPWQRSTPGQPHLPLLGLLLGCAAAAGVARQRSMAEYVRKRGLSNDRQ